MQLRLREKGAILWIFRSPHLPPTCHPSLFSPFPLESAWQRGTNTSSHDTEAAGKHLCSGALADGHPQSLQNDGMAAQGGAGHQEFV